jgi:hypothetical protein
MQDCLNQWGNPSMPTMAPGDMQMLAHGGMPGMLSERELNALTEAKGVDASRSFLTQMGALWSASFRGPRAAAATHAARLRARIQCRQMVSA